jgi:outer membrane lipoprotein LolB
MWPAWMLLGLLLGACAQAPTGPPAADTEFELAGRLGVRYGDESFSGSLAWRHARSSDEMLISTPLGQGVARIVRENDAVTLSTAEPRDYRASDAESLTEQVLGFRLPLGGLADWVRARPAPGSPAEIERAPDGKLQKLVQRGWQIEYQEYSGALPFRLRLSYPGIELRLVISQWK